MNLLKNSRLWVIASYAVFCIGLMTGWTWWDKQSDQYKDYAIGRAAFMTTMYDLSVQYFDRSFADYQKHASNRPDLLTAPLAVPPSLEMAELSQHFKALSLINMGNFDLAVIAFKEALRLTNENALSKLTLEPATLRKVLAYRKVTQIDFEILFHQQEQLAKKEGKGKPEGNKGDKQSDDPGGNKAGKGDRETL